MEFDRTLLAYFISVPLALLVGAYIARLSAKQSRIYGGAAARLFHFVGAAGTAGSLPAVLISLFLGLGFLSSLLKAIIFLGVGFAALLLFAFFERPAVPTVPEDRGWTEQDARRSDL